MRWKSFGQASEENVFFIRRAGFSTQNASVGVFMIFVYICFMDFWTTVGIVSSVLGIFSFLKIDALSIVDFLNISVLFFFVILSHSNIKKTLF